MGCVWNTSCISNVKFLKEVELLQMEADWKQWATGVRPIKGLPLSMVPVFSAS